VNRRSLTAPKFRRAQRDDRRDYRSREESASASDATNDDPALRDVAPARPTVFVDIENEKHNSFQIRTTVQ
jgi:hypothetical protein